MNRRALPLILIAAAGGAVAAQADSRTCLAMLRSRSASTPIPLSRVAASRRGLWEKYAAEQRADAARRAEHESRTIRIGELSMRFAYSKIGDKPKNGHPLYIALHGGGSAPAHVNDSQWDHMKRYYKGGVKQGIYVATRGMTNTWNLHFVGASYPCYDRLIENMILFEDVDPDRVYVLGFSAGGDGVYQIAPRMADRFAAANMSAGHPNGVSPRNLANVPFLLQVGERDSAFNRNKEAAKYFVRLEKLADANDGLYVHGLNVHAGKPHNFRDNHEDMAPQKVLKDPAAWLGSGDRATAERNTHAIAWLDRHTRNPTPRRVVWDLGTRAPSRAGAPFFATKHRGKLHYWLDLSGTDDGGTKGEVIAHLDRGDNAVVIETCGEELRVLLRQGMLDLARPVRVEVGGRTFLVSPKPRLGIQLQTMIDRGDPRLMFDAAVTLRKKGDAWVVEGS